MFPNLGDGMRLAASISADSLARYTETDTLEEALPRQTLRHNPHLLSRDQLVGLACSHLIVVDNHMESQRS